MNKAPYVKPALKVLGEVRTLTLGMNGSFADNGSMQMGSGMMDGNDD